MKDVADFPSLLETFFIRRLIAQRKASPHTIASYRDTFRLLLQFAEKRLAKAPSRLTMEDLNATFLGAFLDHLESTRANGARSRNLRLTALRSFFRYAALESPQHSGLIQRVLAIPNKRQPRPLVGFLTRAEIDALLAAPDSPDVARTSRSCSSTYHRTDRSAARRDQFGSSTRHQPCHGCACSLCRKGAEGAMYSVDQINCGHTDGLDTGAR
jgi:site-specific recombinase XerC